jgi:hypothetical protein
MTNPTNPFNWQMPTASDLVTDLPADFEVFGQAVATSMADLLGGTTGQVLSKTSNTDMDFTWIANDVGDITAVTAGTGISGGGTSGAVTITNSMATEITAKGDLIAGTGSATFDNLPVGTNGQTLVADSTASTGLKWATPASSSAANGTAFVATNENTSSTSYTNLTTAGPATTVTTGTKALVIISAEFQNGAAAIQSFMGVDISGATTLAASDAKAAKQQIGASNTQQTMTQAFIYTGLTAGSNVFTAKYKAGSGTSYFQNRYISVIDMGS